MLKENLYPYTYQDYTSEYFYPPSEESAKVFAEANSEKRQEESDSSDDEHRCNNGNVQQPEADTDSKCIDTCGYRQHK